ncbi:DUF3243 family protein [Thermodesulfitimonas autotrophica]|uniref:Uncharacterized protein DUF3243 n=1 Tax=Thermodesulfitimonas autotrophica TaxID=1894989 RepID=A0A3N5AD60_9THEO|nr:DUF3243 family protein [Thermodesulfitimonas autotrophica]RPF42826.1 uncharacterized protein DUF3243 [Thermodesulfitimonas autotrophica]
MEIDLGWNEFKEWLGKGLKALRLLGVSDENAEDISYRFGELLNRYVDSANREQRLIKELWDQGNEIERRALASMLARLVERDTIERKKPSRLSDVEGPDETTEGRKKP